MKRLPTQSANTIPLAALVGFAVGAVVVGVAWAVVAKPAAAVKPLRESDIPSSSDYQYIDPIIAGGSQSSGSSIYSSLEQSVDDYIAAQSKNGLTSASVKFGDFNSAQGFTINGSEQYFPASLNKVPLMMAYYSLAENDPTILDNQLVYDGQDLDAQETVKSPVQLVPGQSYSVEDLIEHMIRYSDNNAYGLLLNNLTETGNYKVLTSLYGDLGVNYAGDDTVSDYMTVSDYSLFVRVLYNATYLDRDYSEKALSLMTQTDFTDGIGAGVSTDVDVAQKFGEANIADGDTVVGHEFHNCGIVYYPDHPYLLCIMTKGSGSEAQLEQAIEDISKIVFDAVEQRYPTAAK